MQALVDAVLLDLDSMLPPDRTTGATGVAAGPARPREDLATDLAWLARQVRIGVASTGVDADEVRALLAANGLDEPVDLVLTAADADPTAGDGVEAGLLAVAVERLGVDGPARLLSVGTTAAQEAAAEAAGVSFACASGHPTAGTNGSGEPADVTGFSAEVAEAAEEPTTVGLRELLETWLERAAGAGFEAARAQVAKSDLDAANAAAAQQSRLAKPLGALGRLEQLGTQLAAIAGTCPPPVPDPAAVVVFAADHGIAEWDVSPRPRGDTARILATAANGTAAVAVLARQVGARLIAVDVGVDHGGEARRERAAVADDVTFLCRSVREGTGNLAAGPAMTRTEVLLALDVGVECARRAVADGARCLITGDIGVGASTPATAIIGAVTGAPPAEIVGRGSGADDEMVARKVAVVEAATEHLSSTAGPLTVLSEIGGFEIAALAGLIIGAAAERVPVVIDGVIADAATLIAVALAPDAIDYVIAGHRESEPASDAALAHLGLTPLLAIGVHLGEGAGALLALPIVQAAAHILREMATVAEMA